MQTNLLSMSMIQCKDCVGRGWRSLLRYVQEVQEIDSGYAFKFRFSKHLIRRLSDYAAFESRHRSPLTFTLNVKPCDGEMWFQVGPAGEKERIRSAYLPPQGNQALCNGHSASRPSS